jgi:hypothetical protein
LANCNGFPDQCGDTCTDTENDPLNCGDCGDECNADEVCVAGNCDSFYQPEECNQCPCNNCVGDFQQCCEDQLWGVVCVEGDECPNWP